MSVSTSGFALRMNGSCYANDRDCGATRPPYHVCCPLDAYCPTQYNVNCCPTASNCTESLLTNPQCANQTWDLYDNNGYFCCEKGLIGYAALGNSDGCALPGYKFANGEVTLPIIKPGQSLASTSTTSVLTSSTSISTTTTTAAAVATTPTNLQPPESSSSGPDRSAVLGGAIGGTLGGVALIAIICALVWRKRRQSRQKVTPMPELDDSGATTGIEPKTLAGDHGFTELPSSGHARYEMGISGEALREEPKHRDLNELSA